MNPLGHVEGVVLCREALIASLPVGRENAVQGSQLASELLVSERMVRALIEDLVEEGNLILSSCSGARPGYYISATRDDVEPGCAHLISRRNSLSRRVASLRRAALAKYPDDGVVLRLFDPDAEVSEPSAERPLLERA